MNVEILVPLGSFLMITLICFLGMYFSYRKKAIFVEKGYSADEIIKIFGTKRKSFFTMKRIAVMLVGIAFGFSLGKFFSEMTGQGFWFVSILLLCLGVSLFIASKIENKNEE